MTKRKGSKTKDNNMRWLSKYCLKFSGYGHRKHRTRKRPLVDRNTRKDILIKIEDKEIKKQIHAEKNK